METLFKLTPISEVDLEKLDDATEYVVQGNVFKFLFFKRQIVDSDIHLTHILLPVSDDAIKSMKEYAAQKVAKALSENQPVISEEEIKDFAENDYGSPEVEQTSDLESILYKGYMSGYNDGFKKGLSLSSNDKQEKKPLSEISDEDAIGVAKIQGIDGDAIKFLNIPDMKIEIGEYFTENTEFTMPVIDSFKICQYLQSKNYELPVYYPEKKGESNE